MATIAPPPSKRQRREALERTQTQQDVTPSVIEAGSFKARFIDNDGNQLAETIEVPLGDATEKNVSLLLNTLLGREREEFTPYRFRIHIPSSNTIIDNYPTPAEFLSVLRKHGIENPFETTITLAAEPQAVFKVQAVTRMSNKIPGHGEAILAAQFSPKTSSLLATGSGDNTARLWNTDSGTPKSTLKGHTGWVLALAWSPDGQNLATGSMDKTVRIWDESGQPVGRPFNGHSKWITSIVWQPFHLWRDDTPKLASASKDATIRIWIVNTGRIEHVLSGHKASVSCVRWGGTDLIYSASQDKTVKVWDAVNGTLKHTLASHAHWVNHLALSTDFVLRTAFYDHTKNVPASLEEKRAKAKERFEKAAKQQGVIAERVISASDDFTMYLWDPAQGTKPLARLLGHQKQVNHVSFSPDGNLIASAGWDNHIKIWGRDGKFLTTLRAHVAPVYQCAFSADSRLLCSGSRDTTLKVWDMRSFKLSVDLPGHEDEVYALDWSLDGRLVGSGGKDKAVRLWRN
ncbi:YVTN repeat-like/Quino protein amine dehydrogenase [Hypomontagnella submonticulosa]|nr:YVTN repeat-like/Quino protein amine dehydrogenase [Hypomontagnella submonticulosa]